MNNYKLEKLTDFERKFATENHNLVYDFLRRHGYSLENYYDVVIFGFLKAVQIYNRREDLRNKYDFSFISWQYMRSEIGNHCRMEEAKKRKSPGILVSLDAEYAETENLYNCIGVAGGKSPESEVVAIQRVTELLNSISDTQRKIAELKVDGYSSKEIYSALEIKPSTYYVKVNRIKKVLAEMIGQGISLIGQQITERTKNIMFDFKILETETGDQVIDRNLRTPYEVLTPLQMVAYLEMDNRLAYMDRIERKARAEAERKRKIARNPIYRMACLCGLV